MKKPPCLKSLLLIGSLVLLVGCGDGLSNSQSNATDAGLSDTTDSGTTATTTTAPVDNGFRMSLLDQLVQSDQASIDFLIRVDDVANAPVGNLTRDDFQLAEDDQALSPLESGLELVEKDWLDYRHDTVIMVDVSSSMGDLTDVRNDLKTFFSGVNDANELLLRQYISVYKFDEVSTSLGQGMRNALLIQNAVSDITSTGTSSSNIYGAIVAGVQRFNPNTRINSLRQGALIVITDGADTTGSVSAGSTLSAIADRDVYIVDVNGFKEGDAALSVLATGGITNLSSSAGLLPALNHIWTQIDAKTQGIYSLRYISPKRRASGARSESNHTATLSVSDGHKTEGSVSIDFNSSAFTQGPPALLLSAEEKGVVGQRMLIKARVLSSTNQSAGLYSWTTSGGGCVGTPQTLNGAEFQLTLSGAGTCGVAVTYRESDSGYEASSYHTVDVAQPFFLGQN